MFEEIMSENFPHFFEDINYRFEKFNEPQKG